MVKYVYDAWGVCDTIVLDDNATDIANLNPFRYRSYYLDTGLNLYYLKTRYYDPEICRFTTIDDLSYLRPDTINGVNLYAYCRNNPVCFVDTFGKSPIAIIGAALIFTALYTIVVSSIISNITEDDEQTIAAFNPTEDINVLYVGTDVNTICDTTTNAGLNIGLYYETAELNEYNSINIDVAKASASIGYTGLGAGVYLAEISGTNSAMNIFGRTVKLSFGVNYGIGASFNIGSKTSFGVSYGVGFTFSIEVI